MSEHRHTRRPPPEVLRRRRLMAAGLAAAVVAVVAGVLVAASGAHGGRSAAGGGGPTTSAPARSTTTVPLAPVTIAAVGDMELGNTPAVPGDPVAYLQPVAAALAAPVVFGNLEGTLTDTATGSKCGAASTQCYAFRNPTSFAQAFRTTGFTVLNSANNHAHDFDAQGAADTTAALQAAGIAQAGLPGQIAVQSVGRTRVAFVDFAPYPTANNLLDLPGAAALLARARTQADLVVAYMHAGAEGTDAAHVTGQEESYVGEDRGNARAFAHAAVDAGADLVLASGPHVLRGMEAYRGHLVAYSLGNFAGDGNFSTAGTLALSAILRVTLSGAGAFQSGRFTSLLLTGQGQPTIDTTGRAAAFVNQLSTADFGPAAVTIAPDGTLVLPAPAG